MLVDRLGIFKAPNSDEKYIVEILGDGLVTGRPLHTSLDLAADEAKNLLRHYNLPDNEIDSLLAAAEPRVVAAAFAAGDYS
jgi:hypothetical protein